MKTRLDENTRLFGTNLLRKHLLALQQEIDGVRLAQDIEYIHRMRVASRRLRSALPLFSGYFPPKKVRFWQKEIRGITQALGNARDTDVQIDLLNKILAEVDQERLRAGIRRLHLRLSQQRSKLQLKVVRSLEEMTVSGMIVEMSDYLRPDPLLSDESLTFTSPLYRLARFSIQKCLDEFLSYEKIVLFPDRVSELHAMRIAAKKLRYVMETFAPLYPEGLKPFLIAVRKAQETLGNIHDCDVWAQILPSFIENERKRIFKFYGTENPFNWLVPGFTFFQNNRAVERQSQYDDFLQNWQNWRDVALWDNLHEVLNLPVNMVHSISPIPRMTPPKAADFGKSQ
jgi:CHAD domain-containing protein